MLIARFVSHKNRLIKVIRTEEVSSPFEVCLKDNFAEKKKISFKRNFQFIKINIYKTIIEVACIISYIHPHKLSCLCKTGQLPYPAFCCTQGCCTNVLGEIKFISNKWSRNFVVQKIFMADAGKKYEK